VRVLERLEELYAIGGGPGANRVGGSKGEDAAHVLAAEWMREAGLEVEVDDAGNLIGRSDDDSVWTGSHLDSVPNGGKFDGALGVVAAIEAVGRVGSGAAVVFRDEERGCVGSTELVRWGPLPECFVEVHVEQGPVLERAEAPLGLAQGIVGIVRGERVFEGEAGHAGTVPMAGRADALVAAARFILHVRECARPGTVATVGYIEAEPNATNVVPERVTVSVDARSADAALLDRLVEEIGFDVGWKSGPVPMGDAFAAVLPDAPRLVSGAGHDAMFVPNASMLFVRSLNGGVSHHPDELSSAEDIALAIDVLTDAIARLTRSDAR
jgi:allantoate deiminase